MKSVSFCLILSLVSLIYFVDFVSPIFCYDCNSAFDPRCGEEFDSFSLGVVNCSLKDPPDHIPLMEPTICRSIKMEIYGKVRIVRKCGYITDQPGEKSCQRKPGDGDIFVTYCSCDTDLCNSAPGLTASILASVTFLVLSMI